MPKLLVYRPTPQVIAREAAIFRAQRTTTARKAGRDWAPGDTAWYTDGDGEVSLATIIELPYQCSDNIKRVMVRDGDGDWEVKVSSLGLVKPENAKVSSVPKLTKPKTVVYDGELCHCGCGENTTRGRGFKQGHDARFHSRIKKLHAGLLSLSDLKKQIGAYAVKFYAESGKH